MELWDLYDKDRRPLGRTHQRGLPVPPGAYHLAVIVVILNPKGEVLLTRRAPEKDACPGWWENTGGSVLAGETSLEAITRELREETGIVVQPGELVPLLRELLPGAHLDMFAVTKDVPLSQLALQPGETTAAQWLPFGEWLGRVGDGLYLTPSWHKEPDVPLYPRLQQYRDGKRDYIL